MISLKVLIYLNSLMLNLNVVIFWKHFLLKHYE